MNEKMKRPIKSHLTNIVRLLSGEITDSEYIKRLFIHAKRIASRSETVYKTHYTHKRDGTINEKCPIRGSTTHIGSCVCGWCTNNLESNTEENYVKCSMFIKNRYLRTKRNKEK
jgi:hypothetical protein